jgi:hypothetical protein
VPGLVDEVAERRVADVGEPAGHVRGGAQPAERALVV